MAISHRRSVRKHTGGRYKTKGRKQKQYELGRLPAMTHVGKRRARVIRVMGNNQKVRVLSSEVANVLNPKTKKFTQSKIITVVESAANRQYIRRNIMTKGAIINTELGKAKITSRPGQDGTVNAILVQ